MNLSTRILLGLALGVLFGAALNLLFPAAAPAVDRYALSPIGDGFLRLIQFVVVPIVFCSLILALNSLQGSERVGRYAGRLLLLYVASRASPWSPGSTALPTASGQL